MRPDMEDPCETDLGSCRDALEDLFVFLDGQLTVERRLIIEGHIDRCAPCLKRYSFETELRQVIAEKCRDTVPDSLRMRIAEAIGCDPDLAAPSTGEDPSG